MADLITPAELVKSFPELEATEDLAELIADASEAIEARYDRGFLLADRDEIYDGSGTGRIFLRSTPVVAIESVILNGEALSTAPGTYSVTASGELVFGYGYDDVAYGSSWPKGTGNVRVVYTGGYATVPRPVKRACKLLCRIMARLGTGEAVDDGAWKFIDTVLMGPYVRSPV